MFALDFYLRAVVFGQQKAPKEAGGGVKTQAYQLLTPAVNLLTQPDSHFLFPNTLGATGYVWGFWRDPRVNINFLMHSGSRGGRPEEAARGERSGGSHYGTDWLAAVSARARHSV